MSVVLKKIVPIMGMIQSSALFTNGSILFLKLDLRKEFRQLSGSSQDRNDVADYINQTTINKT